MQKYLLNENITKFGVLQKQMRKVYGTCAFLTLDKKKQKICAEVSLNKDYPIVYNGFDYKNPAPLIKCKGIYIIGCLYSFIHRDHP